MFIDDFVLNLRLPSQVCLCLTVLFVAYAIYSERELQAVEADQNKKKPDKLEELVSSGWGGTLGKGGAVFPMSPASLYILIPSYL